jgi:hypothetical protein
MLLLPMCVYACMGDRDLAQQHMKHIDKSALHIRAHRRAGYYPVREHTCNSARLKTASWIV